MDSQPGLERRHSKRIERRGSAAPYSARGAAASTGLTCELKNASLDWDAAPAASGSGKSSVRTKSWMRRGATKFEPKPEDGSDDQAHGSLASRIMSFKKGDKKAKDKEQSSDRHSSFSRRFRSSKEKTDAGVPAHAGEHRSS